MKYVVQRGRIEVKARSSIHDTNTIWSKVTGTIDFDPDKTDAARAEIQVDMRVFDAGDRLKNWKIKGDLDPDSHPTATFTLSRFDQISEKTAGDFEAVAAGQLAWRGKTPTVKVKGKARIDRRAIDAQATFELDVRKELGVTPPRFFMFKVEDVVSVQVTLFAVAE
jgi:polyisoprenoid-binding protein YceI